MAASCEGKKCADCEGNCSNPKLWLKRHKDQLVRRGARSGDVLALQPARVQRTGIFVPDSDATYLTDSAIPMLDFQVP